MVTASDYRGRTALTFAVASGQVALVDTIVALIERKLPADQVTVYATASLTLAAPATDGKFGLEWYAIHLARAAVWLGKVPLHALTRQARAR